MKRQNIIANNALIIALGQHLSELMKTNKVTYLDLAHGTGVPPTTIHRLIHDPACNPTLSSLIPIAKFFNLSISQLLKEESPINNDTLTSNENRIENIVPFIDVHEYSSPKDLMKNILSSNIQKTVFIHRTASKGSFSIQMHDNSMSPQFPAGSFLVFDPLLAPTDGSFVLAYICRSSQFEFKRIHFDGKKRYLSSISPFIESISTIKMDANDVILGSLIEATLMF